MTRKVAELARLELTEDEVRTYTAQLSRVVEAIGELAGVSVDGVEPLVHPLELATPLRDDRARVTPSVIDAPEGFEVPPIL